MFGKVKKSVKEIIAELNEALADANIPKEFTGMIEEFAALKELKSRVSSLQSDLKGEIEKEYKEQGLSGNVKHSGITVGIGRTSTVKTDSEKFDGKKLYAKFPESVDFKMKPGYIKTMMTDNIKAKMLEGLGISIESKEVFKVF